MGNLLFRLKSSLFTGVMNKLDFFKKKKKKPPFKSNTTFFSSLEMNRTRHNFLNIHQCP